MVRKYTIVRCKVGCEPEVADIPRSLGAVQKEVGGYVQSYPTEIDNAGVMLLCDEEGLLKNYEWNSHRPACLVGDFIFIGTKGENWVSLTDKQIKIIEEYLNEEVIDEREREMDID